MRWLVLLLAGCGGPDADLVAQRRALDAWREGEVLLRSDPEAAVQSFAAALDAMPEDDANLRVWLAEALAASGDLESAVEQLDEALRLQPGSGTALYNRAAFQARLGERDAAADDLRAALSTGVRTPQQALLDPDFAGWSDDPRLAFLPIEALQVSVDAPEHPVFWGTELAVRLRVVGAGDTPLSVTAERFEGPVELVRVVENVAPSTAGALRDLTYTFRAVGEGSTHLGPLHVWSGERRASVPELRIETTAPPTRTAPSNTGLRDLPSPQELAGGHALGDVWRVGDEVRVMHRAAEHVVIEPSGPRATWELRRSGQSQWMLTRALVGASDARVQVSGRAPVVATAR